MTGRKPNAERVPEGALGLLALDALARYTELGLYLPGDVMLPDMAERLAGDDLAQ
jgi:hypothetical protein